MGQTSDHEAQIVEDILSSAGHQMIHHGPPSGGLAAESALQLHLEARDQISSHSEDAIRRAEALNLKALEVDPTSHFAHVGLGFVNAMRHIYGYGPLGSDETLARAVFHAERAIELAPHSASAHHVRGTVHLNEGRHQEAVARLERALEFNPHQNAIRAMLASTLAHAGDVAAALREVDRAMGRKPVHGDWMHQARAFILWCADRPDAALSELQRMPKLPLGGLPLRAVTLVHLGQLDAARSDMALLTSEVPNRRLTLERKVQGRMIADRHRLAGWLAALAEAGMPE